MSFWFNLSMCLSNRPKYSSRPSLSMHSSQRSSDLRIRLASDHDILESVTSSVNMFLNNSTLWFLAMLCFSLSNAFKDRAFSACTCFSRSIMLRFSRSIFDLSKAFSLSISTFFSMYSS
ncbi:hypothetical protein RF11_08829 [Thelohanellus kitauei]|uniref:Uncharacterized protein n=1 Tax=Thelohanellus kitauei TaxID=669202 RepID=A0A0C2MBK9_THEKT|nr:hypothetical protein RF11_08829 [Thelohanellus kitauei]